MPNGRELPDDVKSDAAIQDGKCYVSGEQGRAADPSSPHSATYASRIAAAPPGPVSVIGRQTGDTLAAYSTPSGGTMELLYVGATTGQGDDRLEQQQIPGSPGSFAASGS